MNQYDHLKKNLRDYKVEVDKEKLWKNTSHAIPQRRKKRAALFLLSSAIMLGAIGYTYYNRMPALPDQTRVTEKTSVDIIPAASTQVAEIIPAESNPVKNKITEDRIKPTPSNHITSGASTPGASNVTPKTTRVISHHETFTSASKRAEEQIEIPKDVQEPSLMIHVVGETAKPSSNEENTRPMSVTTEGMATVTIHDNDDFRGEAHNLHEDEIAEAHKDELWLNPSLEAVAFLAINLEGLPVEARTGVTGSLNPRVSPAEAHHLSSIQVIQGIGLTTMSIQSLDPESIELAAQLSRTHESLESFSTTVSGNLKLPLGFSVDAGIQYNQLNTKMQHAWTTTERYTREGIAQIIIDQHGLQESVTGNVGVTKYTHIQSTRFTSHENIDLVASLRKTLWNYRRSSLDVFMKGGYNLSYRANGSLLNKDGSVEKFSASDNPYSRSSPFVYGAGLQFQYRISPRLYVNTSMDYQRINYLYQPKDQKVEFRFATYNAAIGIGYSL